MISLPVVGTVVGAGLSLLSYAKPDLTPGWPVPLAGTADRPSGEPVVAAKLSEVAEPWSYKYFVFVQKYPQYDPQRYKAGFVPGVLIRLPWKVPFPQGNGRTVETDLVAYSRICPHLGCIFNYVPDWHLVTAEYGGFIPPPPEEHALLACPCHLSIYDPADKTVPGRVLSGPAPRPPRYFTYEVRGEDVVITGAEPGGIA